MSCGELPSVGGLSRLVLERPLVVLGVLLAITLVFAAFLPGLGISSDLRSMVPPGDPVVQQLTAAIEEFGSQDVVMVVITAPDVYQPSTLQKAWRLGEALQAIPGVQSVLSPLNAHVVRGSASGIELEPVASDPPSTPEEVAQFRSRALSSPLAGPLIARDGTALALVVTLEPGVAFEDEFARVVGPRLEAAVARERGPESIVLVGEPFLGYAITRSIRRDMAVLFPLVVLVVLVSLYASFRTPTALVLPMVPVLLSLLWTLGLMAALGFRLTVVSAALPVMLVVVGSASAIHILNRYREFRQQGVAHRQAVARTMASLTAPLIMVSLTDAAGFASLATSFVQPVKEFGLFTAAAILFSLLLSLMAIPAILSLWEPKALALAADRAPAGLPEGEGRSALRSALRAALRPTLRPALHWPGRLAGRLGPWFGWERAMARVPERLAGSWGLAVLAFSLLAAAGLALGIPGVRVETNLLEYFGPNSPVVAGTRLVERLFGGTSVLSVVIDTGRPDGVKEPALLKRVEGFQRSLEQLPEVAHTQSVADVVRQVNRALHADDPAAERIPDTPQAVAQELLLYSLQGGSGLDSLVNYDYSRLRVLVRAATLPTHRTRQLVEAIEAEARRRFSGMPVDVAVVGIPRIVVRLQERFVPSQLQSMVVAFGVVWCIVSLLMRSWQMGLLALLPLVLTLVMQFGLMGYSGIPLDIATTMIAGITVGVGVDYAIHLLSRYRQERLSGGSPTEALAATLASTGRAIGVNALTLAAGFAVLIFSDFRAVAVLGELLALTMMVSALASLFPLAACLVRLPEHGAVGQAAAHSPAGGAAGRAGRAGPSADQ